MRLTLAARLALAFAALAAITALVTAGVSSASTNRSVKADVDEFLKDRAEDIAEGRRRPQPRQRPREGGVDGFGRDEASVQRAVESDAVVQLLDRRGRLVSSTGLELPISEADKSFGDGRAPAMFRTIEIGDESYRMVTMHIDGGGVVQVAQSISGTDTLLGEIRSDILLLGLGLSGLAAVIGWAVASGTTRPLRRLTRSVESIAETQDLSTPVVLDRGDEIGSLSESFQDLLSNLAASRDQQRRLVQDAAHELRTPLTSVRANVDFLAVAKDLDDESRQAAFASIRSELVELSDLLAEVVELATESRDATTFAPVDLATAVDSALAQFELRSARPVVRDLSSSIVLGDSAMLARAAGNLIGNADKYTPDPAAPIHVAVSDGAVTVGDRGPGIPTDDRAQIFERFWRADEARSAAGSGLGLAIVKKIVDEHGGQVVVRDRDGGGAEVGFSVPPFRHPSELAERTTG